MLTFTAGAASSRDRSRGREQPLAAGGSKGAGEGSCLQPPVGAGEESRREQGRGAATGAGSGRREQASSRPLRRGAAGGRGRSAGGGRPAEGEQQRPFRFLAQSVRLFLFTSREIPRSPSARARALLRKISRLRGLDARLGAVWSASAPPRLASAPPRRCTRLGGRLPRKPGGDPPPRD